MRTTIGEYSQKETNFLLVYSTLKEPFNSTHQNIDATVDVKLDLIKQFFKALDRNSEPFKYFQSFFAELF